LHPDQALLCDFIPAGVIIIAIPRDIFTGEVMITGSILTSVTWAVSGIAIMNTGNGSKRAENTVVEIAGGNTEGYRLTNREKPYS
jgi:hypothetical protein